jgi:citrate synthase
MELPVRSGSVGPDVIDIASLYREQGVFTYDPGFVATGSCESDITFIDGEEGILMYRGYPVEQLAAHSSFIEVSYLLLHGELPTADQLADFDNTIRMHTMLNEGMLSFFKGFRYDAHPMAMLSAVASSARCRRTTTKKWMRLIPSIATSLRTVYWQNCQPSRPRRTS